MAEGPADRLRTVSHGEERPKYDNVDMASERVLSPLGNQMVDSDQLQPGLSPASTAATTS